MRRQPGSRVIALCVALLASVLAACGSTTSPSSSSGASVPVVPPTASPAAAAASPTEAATPGAGVGGVTATPTPRPLTAWKPGELLLLSGVESRVRGSCAPAPQLAAGAFAGIQCRLRGTAAIGYYLFEDRRVARQTYLDRLAETNVRPGSGDACRGGTPGEGVDTPGNPGYEIRIGCYRDAAGIANVRILIPGEVDDQSVYIGAAGLDGDLGKLLDALFPNADLQAVGCVYCVDTLWHLPRQD